MKVRPRHVLHVGVVIAVLAQLAFAAAFLVDSALTNRAYDDLAAHRIAVTSRLVGCIYLGPSRTSGASFGEICRVVYHYRDQDFSAVINIAQPKIFYIDPLDTSVRMNKATFDNGPTESTGDIVFAVLLLLGAVLVTLIHQVHLRQQRTKQRSLSTR